MICKYKKIKPTKTHIRQLLFSFIKKHITKHYLLDLFSGSGNFSISSILLDFNKIITIEKKVNNYKYIKHILRKIKKKKCINLILTDYKLWIKKFNIINISIIIVDPPYKIYYFSIFNKINNLIVLRKCLLIYYESNEYKNLYHAPKSWFLLKKNKLGKVYFYFLKKI